MRLVVWAFITVLAHVHVSATLGPVVIVPGTGGSQLQAKLNKPSTKHIWCSKTSDWYTIWLSITNLLQPAIYCWCENIKLLWNPSTREYSNNAGVSTRVPGWGSTNSIEFLDPSIKAGKSAYFHALVTALVAAGLQRNVTVRGAPYDFRRTPDSAGGYDGQFVSKMKALVEETYGLSGNQTVTLLSHSMGCVCTLYFLNHMAQDWKDMYIRQWIPTAGVFAGAGEAVAQLMSGSSEGIPGVSGLTVREEQRSYQSNMWLLPSEQVWDAATPLVLTPSANYSAHDYEALFARANFTHGFARLQQVANLTSDLLAPGVNTTHLYGLAVETPTQFQWKTDASFPDTTPTVINADGDGAVPVRSLKAVEKWALQMPGRFHSVTYAGQTHTGILQDRSYIDNILAMLS